MAVTTAVLGGTTLPHVAADGYDEGYGYRGADREMLDGSVATDLVSATAKRTFELRWRELTETQVGTVRTAFATVKSASASFTSPLGGTYTVTRDVGFFELEIKWRSQRGSVGRAAVTMRLREV